MISVPVIYLPLLIFISLYPIKHNQHSFTGNNCGNKGDVLIYNIDGDPDAHAAVALGNCKLDQHNPSRCGTAANWGPNKVLSKR